jgi:hypothetical protein
LDAPAEEEIMKKLTLAALALVAVSAAFADDITPDNNRDVPSLKSRDQVVAERNAAVRDGSSKVWSTTYNQLAVTKSVKTRGTVLVELRAAQADGTLNAFNGEDSGAFALARTNGRVQPNGTVLAGK